ncbi:hypothetical protein ACHAXN_002191 [Cyclotella atomus]
MSRQMVQSFFPSFIQYAQNIRLGNWIWETLFPTGLAEQCPEPVYEMISQSIRLPYLGVSAILGVAIGAVGSMIFGYKVIVQRSRSIISNQCRCNVYLCVAYLTFGAMNMCGLVIHCIWDAPSPSYPVSTPILWALDCYFTGVSASSLAFASLESILSNSIISSATLYTYVVLQVLAVYILVQFMMTTETTILLEMWYLAPVLPAGFVILFDVVLETMKKQSNQSNAMQPLVLALWNRLGNDDGLRMFMFGCTFALGGIVWDSIMCQNIGTSTILYDLFTASTCLFLGCDFAFIGVLVFWCNRANCKNMPNANMKME